MIRPAVQPRYGRESLRVPRIAIALFATLLAGCGDEDRQVSTLATQGFEDRTTSSSSDWNPRAGSFFPSDLPQAAGFRVGPALRSDGVHSVTLAGSFQTDGAVYPATLEVKTSSIQALTQRELGADSELKGALARFERGRKSIRNAIAGEPARYSFLYLSISLDVAGAPQFRSRQYDFFSSNGEPLGGADADGEVSVQVGAAGEFPEFATCGDSGGLGSAVIISTDGERQENSLRWLLSCEQSGMAELAILDSYSEFTVLVSPDGAWEFQELTVAGDGFTGRFHVTGVH